MTPWRVLFASSPGKKLLNGATGLLLAGFVVVHLVGNLTFLIGPHAFNGYAHFLETLAHGWFLVAAEIGLLAVLTLHALAGALVWLDKRRARDVGYARSGDAGGASRKTFASRTMIWTGLALAAFIVVHVRMFRFGPAAPVAHGGTEMRDLYGLVVHAFRDPVTAWLYAGAMVLLGFHLRHGLWSMLQSLGWTNARALPWLYGAALVAALLLAACFLFLPLYIHYGVDPALARVAAGGGA